MTDRAGPTDLFDESVLTDLLGALADDNPIPADGAEHVLDGIVNTSRPSRAAHADRGDRARVVSSVLAVAAVVACIAVAVPVLHGLNATASKSSSARVATDGTFPFRSNSDAFGGSTPTTTPSDPGHPDDAAKIVKTGTLDLQVAHATLRANVNRVVGVTVGLGGYIADSRSDYGGSNPTAQVTMRVPADRFDTAIARLDALPDVKVLGESENGTDVTAQFTDLQAQLAAATSQRDALLVILSRAQSIADILAVRDRVTAAQTEVDRLQGRVNLLDRQATYSSLAVSLAEGAASGATPAHNDETGLAKSWSDARHGFTSVVEWILARSGAALIILLFALALVFGVRYLYPIVRRGLV